MAKHNANRLPGVVVGSLVALGGAWLGGVVVAAGKVPVWAVPAAVGVVAVAAAVAWLLGKVSHGGGDWSDGRGRAEPELRGGNQRTFARQHA